MQRRSLLKLGAGAGLVLAAAGGGFALLRPAWQQEQLTPAGQALFRAVASAVLDGLLPSDPDARALALDGQLRDLNTTLAGLPPGLQAEVAQLGAVLCSPPGRMALAGLTEDWADASPASVAGALQRMRLSRLALRQQAYHALRDLSNAAWFAQPGHWASVGYPGPRQI